MDARTPIQAAEALRASLQTAVSCVSRAVVLVDFPVPPDVTYGMNLSHALTPLGRRPTLAHTLRQRCTATRLPLTDRWTARTSGYSYTLMDRDGQELLVYQWDTTGNSPVTSPHAHVGRSLAHASLPEPFRQQVGRLTKAHLPTGHVTAAAILHVAITDLGVVPLREDWASVLDREERVLRASLPRDGDGG